MKTNENPSALEDCTQQCEEGLAACLDGNSEGTCQLDYNQCRFVCDEHKVAVFETITNPMRTA